MLIRTLFFLTFDCIYDRRHPFDIFFSLLNTSFPAGLDQRAKDRRRISAACATAAAQQINGGHSSRYLSVYQRLPAFVERPTDRLTCEKVISDKGSTNLS